MVCPLCPAVGWLGGWLGGCLGIQSSNYPGARILSAAVTANLISITIIALRVLFDISLCVAGASTLGNVVRVISKTFVLGVIYSIGVNYVLNRYVFPRPKIELEEKTLPPCCCRAGKK